MVNHHHMPCAGKQLQHEEMLWKQKAKCDWLNLEDHNTKFFHTRALQRRKNNSITAIRSSYGDQIFGPVAIEKKATNFFQSLYGEDPEPLKSLPPHNFPKLDKPDLDFLSKQVTDEEVKTILFYMALLKAPDNDGFHALFFQKKWGIVGSTICEWVKKVFNRGGIEVQLNNTLIVLIPKV